MAYGRAPKGDEKGMERLVEELAEREEGTCGSGGGVCVCVCVLVVVVPPPSLLLPPTHQPPHTYPHPHAHTRRTAARKNFSRRRANFEAEDVTSINERNKNFNKKLKRAFDKYTVEIRQNLERGTAL